MSTNKSTRTTRPEFQAQNRKFLEDRLAKGNKTLITYVRDEWGQKKGVIVALSPTEIGWSLVHQDKDSFYKRVKPAALPIVNQLQRRVALFLDSYTDNGDLDFLDLALGAQDDLINVLTKLATGNNDLRPGVIKCFTWDREKGLHDAFKRALGGKFGNFTKAVLDAEGKDTGDRVSDTSVDKDVVITLERVLAPGRLEKFFAVK